MTYQALHPAGRFEATVLDHGLSESKTGTPSVWIKFETEHGHITYFGYLTDKAAEYAVRALRAAGFEGTDMAEVDDGQCMIGNKCIVVVEHEDYENETRAKVRWVNSLRGPRDPAKTQAIAQTVRRFNPLLKAKPAKAHAPAEPPPSSGPPAGPAVADDEIPF